MATSSPPSLPISSSAQSELWAYWDDHYGTPADSSSARTELLPRDDAGMEALVTKHGLSRSQTKRQWDRWRRGRREKLLDDELLTGGGGGGSGDSPMAVGTTVELRGLKAKPELNGQRGVVSKTFPSIGRCSVRLEDGRGPYKIKLENLSAAPPPRGPLPHEHCGSLYAHRRRAFGADDTLHNRLHSIAYDARYVARVASRFEGWPVVANLRCGAWYVNPMLDQEHQGPPPSPPLPSVRFKSTDGHFGEWALSLRRLNLHLLSLLTPGSDAATDESSGSGESSSSAGGEGVILVDSTRRGRLMPDSFAKTVPIWCACVNRVVALERGYGSGDALGDGDWDTALHTPPSVSAEERVAIEERLDGFAASLHQTIFGDAAATGSSGGAEGAEEIGSGVAPHSSPSAAVLRRLQKPLRPFWLTPEPAAVKTTRRGEEDRGVGIGVGDAVGLLALLDVQVHMGFGPGFKSNLRNAELPFHPLVCLSASEPVDRRRRPDLGFTYLQGCADDEEVWAALSNGGATPRAMAAAEGARADQLKCGRLTAELFWRHGARLLSADPAACAAVALDVVAAADAAEKEGATVSCEEGGVSAQLPESSLASAAGSAAAMPPAAPSAPSGSFDWVMAVPGSVAALAVGGRRAGRPPGCWRTFDAVINVTLEEYDGMRESSGSSQRHYLHCPVAEGKKDRRGLAQHLPKALRFAAEHLSRGRRLLVHCAQGRDRSVAVAVAVLAAFFDERGQPLERLGHIGAAAVEEDEGEEDLDQELDQGGDDDYMGDGGASLRDAQLRSEVFLGMDRTKPTITRCLHWITLARPAASPSRHTIKKLHRFFSGMD